MWPLKWILSTKTHLFPTIDSSPGLSRDVLSEELLLPDSLVSVPDDPALMIMWANIEVSSSIPILLKVLNLSVGGCHTLEQGKAPISHQGQWCNTRLQLHHQDFYNSCGLLDPSSGEYGAFEQTTSGTFFQRQWYLRSHCSLILEESPPGSQACLDVKNHQLLIPLSMLLVILLTFASWLVRVCLAHFIG